MVYNLFCFIYVAWHNMLLSDNIFVASHIVGNRVCVGGFFCLIFLGGSQVVPLRLPI